MSTGFYGLFDTIVMNFGGDFIASIYLNKVVADRLFRD